MFIFVLFMIRNPLLSFLFCSALAVLTGTCFMTGVYPGKPFEQPYKTDETQFQRFYNGGYRILGDKEWYLPVDGFNPGRAYVPADDLTFDFASETPNPDYPGKTATIIGQTLFRANIMYYPCEIIMWFIYPMYRDGLFVRYAAVSSCYLLLTLTAGCYAFKKRNID